MGNLRKVLQRGMQKLCISRPRALWQRYVIGFLFIFVTISASHWASLETIKLAKNDAETISVSNRQRMLSQRILFLLSETRYEHDPFIEQRLETAIDLFETSHEWLITRPDLTPGLRRLYFEKEPISLDAFSRRFVQMAGIASTSEGKEAEDLLELLAQWGTEDLIASLATAADLFRRESEERIARLQVIQTYTLIAALVVLLIEALVIFLPAQLSVNRAIRRLEQRKKLLKASLGRLKARNTELLDARQNLTRAANHDALTGLLNRRAVYEHLGSNCAPIHGADFTRCVMKVDLDYFKKVNDSLGHNAGDRVLKRVADVLTSEIGESEVAGRIGGDEFVIVIDNPKTVEAIENLATRLIRGISQPLTIDNMSCRVGACIGYTFALSSEATPDQLLIEADLALYEAKRAGRGCARAYSSALAAQIEARRLLFNEITHALAADQFEAYLQPQVHSQSGALHGCEVLARWRHPDRGIVPPGTFIAAAEEAGLIDQIDRIILEKGLDALEALRAEGIDIPYISVNASPSTLRDPLLAERLLQEVHARHLSPDNLTVEVLESTLIESQGDTALQSVERLRAAGFAVVLDDFGTGYASMSNLSLLELNGLKLDQSLIRPVPDPRADSIISALVSLSRSLDMTVVAEGVETAEHMDTVRRLGCDIVQGFGIGKPMAVADFVAWYRARYIIDPGQTRAG